MAAPIHIPRAIEDMPAHRVRGHVHGQARQLFAHVFRVMTHTQNLNQQLWEERQELHRGVRGTRRRRWWLARQWSHTDDEILLQMLDKQLATNTATILWCQQKLARSLQLNRGTRAKLQELLEAHGRGTSFRSFVQKFLSTIVNLGGVAALLYVADYYYRGSKGWNALVSALGWYDLKLQQVIGARELDWFKQKLGLQPHTIYEKFWSAMASMVKQHDPSKAFFLRRLSSKARWLASTGLGAAVAYATGGLATGVAAAATAATASALRGGGGAQLYDRPLLLMDWAVAGAPHSCR